MRPRWGPPVGGRYTLTRQSPRSFDAEALRTGAAELGLVLDDDAIARFARFAATLADANQRTNLTRIDPAEYVALHFLDSLAIAAAWRPGGDEHLIDVGAGAGFPGIPLAIAFPRLHVTLLDGTRKKLDFVDSVIAELGLTNATTVHGRAEEIGRQSTQRGMYDIAVARAVARLPRLAGWLLPFVRPGGIAVAYKSGAAENEVEEARPAIERAGVQVHERRVSLPGTGIERTLVIMRKPERPDAGARRERGKS